MKNYKAVKVEGGRKWHGNGIMVAVHEPSPFSSGWYGIIWDPEKKEENWVVLKWVQDRKEDKKVIEKEYIEWLKWKVYQYLNVHFFSPYDSRFLDKKTAVRFYLRDNYNVPLKYLNQVIPDERVADEEVMKICNIVFAERTDTGRVRKMETYLRHIHKRCEQFEVDKLDGFEESLKINLMFFTV